jgi:hypothetical protein
MDTGELEGDNESDHASLKRAAEVFQRQAAVSQALTVVLDLEELVVVRLLGQGAFSMVVECRPREAALVRIVERLALKILMNYHALSTKTFNKVVGHCGVVATAVVMFSNAVAGSARRICHLVAAEPPKHHQNVQSKRNWVLFELFQRGLSPLTST